MYKSDSKKEKTSRATYPGGGGPDCGRGLQKREWLEN